MTADIHQVNAHDEKHRNTNRLVKQRKDYIILAHYLYNTLIVLYGIGLKCFVVLSFFLG